PPTLVEMGTVGIEQAVADTAISKVTLRQIEMALGVDIRDEAAAITAETLVIGCLQDQLVPVEGARELHRLIPGSEYAEIDAAHLVLFEKPDELMKLITGFVG